MPIRNQPLEKATGSLPSPLLDAFSHPGENYAWSCTVLYSQKKQRLRFCALAWQGESEQRPHKVSYHVSVKGKEAEQQISQLEASLKEQGLAAKVIYSGGADLDILPQHASKGKGLEFLLKEVRKGVLITLPLPSVSHDKRWSKKLPVWAYEIEDSSYELCLSLFLHTWPD